MSWRVQTSVDSDSRAGVFVEEIRRMMYVSGDVRQPCVQVATVIESLVKQQLDAILFDAAHLAIDTTSTGRQNVTVIHLHQVLYTLRSKRPLLRLAAYFDARDLSRSTFKEDAENDDTTEPTDGTASSQSSRSLSALESSLDQFDRTGELIRLINDGRLDETKRRRLEAMANRVADFDQQQYLHFHDTRRSASFCPTIASSKTKQTRKFADWLFGSNSRLSAFTPGDLVLEVLNFVAMDLVSSLVDCCLLVIEQCCVMPTGCRVGVKRPLTSMGGIQCEHLREAVRRLSATTASVKRPPGWLL